MTSVTLIIPVKCFHSAKQRISGLLSPNERFELASAMFDDTVTLARAAAIFSDIIVTTSDPQVQKIAENRGLRIISETASGLSAAIDESAAILSREHVENIAILPTDIPMATPEDLRLLMTRHVRSGTNLTIALAQKDQGTNFLVMSPPGAIPTCYGARSGSRHLANARSLGLTAQAFSVPSLARDIDDASDIAFFMKRVAAGRSWKFLKDLKIQERLAAFV